MALRNPPRDRSIRRALVRQAELRAEIRCRSRQEAGRGSRLLQGEAAESDLHHRTGRHRPDAVAADERILQQSFKETGIDIDFKVVELETLYTHWRKGAADEMNAGITANNIAYVTSDPLYAIVRFFHSSQIAPVGVNWGGYKTRRPTR